MHKVVSRPFRSEYQVSSLFLHCQSASHDQVPGSSDMQWWRCLWPLVLPWFPVAANSYCRSSTCRRVSHSSREIWPLVSRTRWWQQRQPHAQGLHWCWTSPQSTPSPLGDHGGFVSHAWNSLDLPLHISGHSGWKMFQTFESTLVVKYVVKTGHGSLANNSKTLLEFKASINPH